MKFRYLPWTAILILMAFIVPIAEGREKIDEIVMDNGDRIICEIRELERGILKVKPDYTKGYVYLEWLHIDHISSSQLFEFEISDGRTLYGTIQATETARLLDLETAEGLIELNHAEIVQIAQIEENFLDRTRGSIEVGLTALRANGQIDLNVGGSFTYRQRRYSLHGDFSSLLSSRDDIDDVSRNHFSSQVERYINKKLFYQGHLGFQQNSELDLDLRTTLGVGIGRFLNRSSKSRLSILGGLNANREDYATEFDPLTSLEAVFELDYQLFLFTGHDTKFSLALSIFPSLSQSGRVRTNLNSSLYSNLVGDLYWDLSIIASTDNQPPELSKGNDWSLISSLRFFF